MRSRRRRSPAIPRSFFNERTSGSQRRRIIEHLFDGQIALQGFITQREKVKLSVCPDLRRSTLTGLKAPLAFPSAAHSDLLHGVLLTLYIIQLVMSFGSNVSRRFSCAGWPEPRSKSSWIVHENRGMIGRRGVAWKCRCDDDIRLGPARSPSRISGK